MDFVCIWKICRLNKPFNAKDISKCSRRDGREKARAREREITDPDTPGHTFFRFKEDRRTKDTASLSAALQARAFLSISRETACRGFRMKLYWQRR